MTRTSITRVKMVEALVAHSINTAASKSQQDWLNDVFEKGFVGYGKLSERQLLLEMQLHGLMPIEGVFEDDADADEDALHDQMFY